MKEERGVPKHMVEENDSVLSKQLAAMNILGCLLFLFFNFIVSTMNVIEENQVEHSKMLG